MVSRSLFYLQSPVGNRSYASFGASVSRGESVGLDRIDGWHTHWFGSGTAALAAAVLEARKRKPVSDPRVLVPAYGCPDLVSALRFAGAQPVYVDMRRDETVMNLDLLVEVLRGEPNTIAIIGVDLFGLPENWTGLKSIADDHGLFLIQDFAQSVQDRTTIQSELQSDAAVFSFGRGKPVCCLGGGALLTKSPKCIAKPTAPRKSAFFRVRNSLYNFLLHPAAYIWLARIMGDRLGETRYKPLPEITSLPNIIRDPINRAVEAYWTDHDDRSGDVYQCINDAGRGPEEGVTFVGNMTADIAARRLSRMPLVASSEAQRHQLLERLRKKGISATVMYGRSLPEIVAEYDGRECEVKTPNAWSFARQLMTLPVHSRLRSLDLACMQGAITQRGGSSTHGH